MCGEGGEGRVTGNGITAIDGWACVFSCCTLVQVRVSAAFAPGPERIAHSGFTCVLEQHESWLLGGLGGAGRGEACGADIFPSQMLCSLTRGSDFILSSFLLHIFWSLSMLSNLAISTGKRCDAPHMLLLWLSGLQSWLSSPNNGMFRGFLPTYITHTQSKWLLLFEAPLTSLFRWCT